MTEEHASCGHFSCCFLSLYPDIIGPTVSHFCVPVAREEQHGVEVIEEHERGGLLSSEYSLSTVLS